MSDVDEYCLEYSVGNLLIGFLSDHSLFFTKKWVNERFDKKNERFAHFQWTTCAICSQSLFCHERPERLGNERIALFLNLQYKKTYKIYDYIHIFRANCSFFVSKRANEWFDKKTSDLLICSYHERPEWIPHGRSKQFTHSCSFVLSNLSELLTVTH